MSRIPHSPFSRLAPLLALSCCAIPAAHAEELPVPSLDALPAPGTTPLPAESQQTASAPPSQNVTINLINRLVKKGVLAQEDANELIRQAEADARTAKAQQQAAVEAAVAREAAEPIPSDDVRVSYVPETVKNQIREEVKQDVLEEARVQKLAVSKSGLEEATSKRFRFFGDIRLRYEGSYFPDGNSNTGAFPNFNAINTGAPFDVTGTQFSPQLNVDQDRERLRLRARGGVDIDLEDGFSAGLRLATGESNSPVSPNQSLGAAGSGQGGNFSKYAIWLDRSFIRYNFGDSPYSDITLDAGRFDNPFFSSDIVWDDDLGFDGLAARGKFEVTDTVQSFVTAGAFPVFNTDFNFSSNRPAKFESTDKWLYAAQAGINWKIADDLTAKFALAYYDFQDVEGRLSTPFTPLTNQDAGDTDGTRPSFAQKGNTYRMLRNIIPDASNGFGTTNQFQYFGLATPFRELAATGRLDYDGYKPVRLSLVGEYVQNLAFDSTSINAVAVNNRGTSGSFDGGDQAWMLNFQVGDAALEAFGNWNAYLGYRYVESDSVVDGLTDSDFGGGGTNLKGFTLGANFALSRAVRLGARWMSADEIAGPTYRNDILQLDLNAKF